MATPAARADRQRISSGSPWEPIVGYSRAVRVGNMVFVAGTTATDESGQVVHAADVREQTRYALQKIARALAEAGASLSDVVRTRIYVTDIERWKGVAEAHGELFAEIRPASTMVEVAKLIHEDMLVEIEVDAVIGTAATPAA